MNDEFHYFKPSQNKKLCKVCQKIYSQCMKWVDLFVIEGPKERNFYGKSLKAKHVTDLYTYELVSVIKGFERDLKIVEIESTTTTSYLVNNKGRVFSWGVNDEVAHSDKVFKHPELMRSLYQVLIISIACGDNHVLALETGLYVWAWGENDYGQLGKSDPSASRITSINRIIRITAGKKCSFAVTTTGILYAWGDNSGMTLGVESDREIVDTPTEFEVNPWNLEGVGQRKAYFKTEISREVIVAGASKTTIKLKKLENHDLSKRINFLTKKNDFLEDESNNKKLHKVWEKDIDLKSIIKLRESIENKNKEFEEKKIKKDEKINLKKQEIVRLEEELKKLENEILQDWDTIEDLERQISEVTDKNKNLKKMQGDTFKDEIAKNETKITNNKEIRREKHAKVVYAENQKEKTHENITKIKNKIEKLNLKKTKLENQIDKHMHIYNDMVAIKKKQITEEKVLGIKSQTFEELTKLILVKEAVKMSTVDKLTLEIGEYAFPEELIQLSDQMLEILGQHIESKFRVSGSSFVGQSFVLWTVLIEMIRLIKEANKIRTTIMQKMLLHTRKKLEDWNKDHAKKINDHLNNILEDAGIEIIIPFEDLTSKVKERENNIKKEINKKKALDKLKASNWRSCF